MTDATDSRLAAQYEAYPYPARDPADETRRLVIGSPSHLREIDHWVFGAARPMSRPLRALVAGGGTGDGTIMLAQQLVSSARPGQVTYLDRSAAAAGIARARAKARGLTIAFHEGSLLGLPGSGLGPFDYIDCCGVLHHLPDPAAGLQALLSVLAPGGGLGLMVYAPHGRTGVYMLQDALRLLAPEAEPPANRLDTARRVMRHLPASAWLGRNTLFSDHLTGGDAGLYDLLLNPRDRAYDVPALHALLTAAGLHITCWMEPLRYDPPDATNPAAVPVMREMPGAELAKHIRPDGTLPFLFDGLRVPIPLPPLSAAILRLIDGQRSVGAIAAALAGRVSGDAFVRAWRDLYGPLCGLNRLLLAPPP
jgi:SAM-dependent methyltransferase